MEWAIVIIVIIAVLVLIGYLSHLADKAKRKKLMLKYNDENLVERLMKQEFWQGQTSQQLLDSIGKPESVHTQVLKTKTKEIWKYNRVKSNQFGLKITIENGIVVGWDQK